MQERIRATLLVGILVAMAAGCGHVAAYEPEPAGTPVRTAAPTTTITTATVVPATSAAPSTATGAGTCLSTNVAGLKLNADHGRDLRSFAGADESQYRARAQALADQARQIGCPVPASIQGFLR